MGESATLQLQITDQETEEARPPTSRVLTLKRNKWWFQVAVYSFLVLSGQAVATLLGRQYFEKGGKSKWMATLVQLVGFPIIIPFYFFSPLRRSTTSINTTKRTPPHTLASVYISLGLISAADCFLYSVGLLYLPVTTYSLICASQLAFNAFFSYFLNSQRFTPFIVNSLILLTTSSALLVSQTDSSNPDGFSRGKYIIGFICTVGASAGYGFTLSLTQLIFKKVIKRESFAAIMDLIIYQSLVASSVILVGLFASGEFKSLKGEMEGYKLGKVSYVMNLIWTAVSWAVFAIGAVGLIFEVSSLFSNAISVLGLPVVPILAVIVFEDKMDGPKVIAMVLAIWGFISYVYQHYIDDCEAKANAKVGEEVAE